MDAPKILVKCGVDSCLYNEHEVCYARSLEVNPKGSSSVRSSDGTCCTTFKPQD